jgi:hypothetical protein
VLCNVLNQTVEAAKKAYDATEACWKQASEALAFSTSHRPIDGKQQGVCKDCHREKTPFLQRLNHRRGDHNKNCTGQCNGDAECRRPSGMSNIYLFLLN